MNGSDLELRHHPARGARRGAPLLFIHGGFHGAWCWADHFMPWFSARGFDCYAVSYREHGESHRTERHAEWRLADYVSDVKWAAKQIGTVPILAGHSLGGSIAQKLVADGAYPAMILLAPSPIGGSSGAALRMLFHHPGPMLRAVRSKDFRLALPAFMSFFVSSDLPRDQRERIAQRCNGRTSLRAANDAFFRDTPQPKRLGIPVLVVSGENDWSIPREKNLDLARAYGGDHIVVPTAHDIMCDTCWETAASQLLSWLDAKVC